MKIKRWMMAIIAALAVAACAGPTTGPAVARVDNVVLTRQELDQRIALAKANPLPGQNPQTDQQIERALVGLFIQQHLLLNLARQRGVAIDGPEIDNQIEQLRFSIANQGGPPLDEVVRSQLGLPNENSSEFRLFASSLVAQSKLAATLVTTDTVLKELNDEVMAQVNQKAEQFHLAHIVVPGEEQAKLIIELINQGQAFESLVQEYSQDPNTASSGGDLGWFQPGQLPPEIDEPLSTLQPGEIVQTPIQLEQGYHIFKIIGRELRSLMTEEEAQQVIEQRLGQELQVRRNQALQQLMVEERERAINEQRLIEPTYVEATPQAVPEAVPEATPAP